MHGASRMIKNVFIGILDFLLVLDACIGICSGDGSALDYLVVVINVFVLLLAFAHYRIQKKHNDNRTLPTEDQPKERDEY